MSQKLLKIGPDIAQLVRISRPAWRCEGYNQPLERERLPRHSAVPTLSSSLTQPSSRRTNSGAQLRGREGPQLDKHGQCVTIPVCAQQGDFWGGGGGERWLWERRRGQAPRAFCSMYSAHSSQSDLLQSQSSVPACGGLPARRRASTWPCQLPGPVAWVNKAKL